jgi:DNA (cytosine-5)-methyltransferase 1
MGKYDVGSLFAGVGGICQAFKDASCNVLWANENDKNSRQTYEMNHIGTELIPDDVKDIVTSDLAPIDILTAGFPCQPFSMAGHGKGFDDDRGKLFSEVIRFLTDFQPKAYLLENVKTLATHNEGKSFAHIRDEIRKAGYSFIPFILNASDYSEIPQGRERIYIVGFKNEAEFSYHKPIMVNSTLFSSEESARNPCSANFRIPPKLENQLKPIKDFLDNSTVTADDYYNNEDDNIIHFRVKRDVVVENIVYQYRRWYVRENKSNVCPTLTANMGGGGHNIPIILDGDTPRRLTPKECFNLQGFDKGFKLPYGKVPKTQLYKQSGNTVVVPLVARIAEEIVRVLDENGSRQP